MDQEIRTIDKKEDLSRDDFKYDYNPELTRELDTVSQDFDKDIINKITLWKVNRYPYLADEIIGRLNEIKNDTEYKNEHKKLLIDLLSCEGIQLPMASTYLRLRNPRLFQIIDQRVYRLINGHELSLPLYKSEKNRQSICRTYFDYLNKLREKCKELNIPFEQADRILYNADKRINKNVKLKNYGG